MAETATKLSVKNEMKAPETSAPMLWRPFEGLRSEIDRLFRDFERGNWLRPFGGATFDTEPSWLGRITSASPAVDIVENAGAYELSAELPGIDEKSVEVNVANGLLSIKGEKREEKEEKNKDYFLRERHYGAFERTFRIPETVQVDKIEAGFKKGILTVTLPKKAEARQAPKKIEVKAA